MAKNNIRGAYTTYDATSTELNTGGIFRIRDIEPDIIYQRPYSGVLYKLYSRVPHGEMATQDKHEWGEREIAENFVTVMDDAAAGDTSVTVNNAYNVIAGDKLFCPRTEELFRADAIDSATVISFASTTGYGRGFAGSTAAALRPGDRLIKLGTSLTEKGRSPDTSNIMPESKYNYCSYYVKAVESTVLQENAQMLGNFGKLSEQMISQLEEFHREINADLWFGRKTLDVVSPAAAHDSGGGNLYQMDGFDAQVKSNVFDLSSVPFVPWELWDEMLSEVFSNDGGARQAFCGRNAFRQLQNLARTVNIQRETYPTVIPGVNVTRMEMSDGILDVVPDFEGLPPDKARIVHPGFMKYLYRAGMEEQWIQDTKLGTQIMEEKHTLRSGGTLVVKNESVHAIIDGIPGAWTRGIHY